MITIAKVDWDRVHELACEIVNASSADDDILVESRKEELMHTLDELQLKYGPCSRITATRADYTDIDPKPLYLEALHQAREEGELILESLDEIKNEEGV